MMENLYTPAQVAGLLGLHVRTIRTYIRGGLLKAVRIGKHYRIAAEDLAEATGQPISAFQPPPVALTPDTACRIIRLLREAANLREQALPPHNPPTTIK